MNSPKFVLSIKRNVDNLCSNKKAGMLTSILLEFMRYCLVGGTAFIIDFAVLYVTRTYVFFALGTMGILLATTCGFVSGLTFNYIFSLIFVFKDIDENVKKHKIHSFVVFAIIGISGLCITELFMFTGVKLLGNNFYLFVKIITAGFVLVWNYIARKILIFKGVRHAAK
jgi:putative flippase GtrA